MFLGHFRGGLTILVGFEQKYVFFEGRNGDLKNQFIRNAVNEPLALSHQMVKNFERAPFTRFVLSLRSLASLAHSTRSLRSLTTPAQNSSPFDALIEY